MKYSVVDLFCGAGGLSKGFMDAGFDVKIGIDWDDAALVTFGHNHGDAEAMKLDLFNLENVKCIKDKLIEVFKSNLLYAINLCFYKVRIN